MAQFSQKGFYYFLVGVLGLLLAINFLLLISGNFLALITISILGAVLFGVLNKKNWIDKGLYAWSSILILAGASSLLATFLRFLDYQFFDGVTALQEIVWPDVIFRTILLVIGLAIIILTKKTVTIPAKAEAKENESATDQALPQGDL